MNLLNDKFSIEKEGLTKEIINNPLINKKDILLTYLEDPEAHSTLYCTFYDLFMKVYGRIVISEHKDELWKRLNEEMDEAECKCFTGRLSRLVNVLNGYYHDITINISENEQIY
jgi:hypothetical protein